MIMMMEEILLTKLRTLTPFQQQEVLDFVDFLAHKQENYTLDRVLTRIRESDQTEDPAVFDAIIEEARADFYKSKS